MRRLLLLGPLKLIDASESGDVLVFSVESSLAPTETIELEVERIAQLLVHEDVRASRGKRRVARTYYTVYEAADDEEFGRLQAYSTDWPDAPLKPVTRVRERWFIGSECDGKFYPGEWIDETTCVPRYKEVDVTVPFRSVDRGDVYARSPTARDVVEWRAVGSNNILAVADWVLGGRPSHTGGVVKECDAELGCWDAGFHGPVPDPARVLAARVLEPPFEALVLAERGFVYRRVEGSSRSVRVIPAPLVLLAFHHKGELKVYAVTAPTVSAARRLYERVLERLGPYAGTETSSIPDALADLAEEAARLHAEREVADALRSRTPKWAVGVVVVKARDGRLFAYPVKRSKNDEFYYFRVKWRPVDEGRHLEPLLNKLVLKTGEVDDVLWEQDGEWVRVYGSGDLPPARPKRMRMRMEEGVDVGA